MTSTSTKSFTYDANGNRLTMTTGGQTTTYSWDYEDRLTSVSGSGTTAANVYNGLDLRVDRTSLTGAASYYTCDGADPASPVLRDGPDVYTQGLCQTLTSTGATSWYVLDRLGSNTRTMNAAENVTDTQVFDGFGCIVNRTGTTTLPFGFDAKSGYQTDSDTGLMLLGHRFYDPSIGRFLSRDPIHAGDNDYAYCENNPITAVDPSGEHLGEPIAPPFAGLKNEGMTDEAKEDNDETAFENAKEGDQKDPGLEEDMASNNALGINDTGTDQAVGSAAGAVNSTAAAKPGANDIIKKADDLVANPNEYAKIEKIDKTDCGRFVSHVIRSTGIDPSFPIVGSGEIEKHITGKKSGWTYGKPGSGGPNPGDVLVVHSKGRNHVAIYIGKTVDKKGKANYTIDEASLGQHIPERKTYSAGYLSFFDYWARR